GVPVLGHGPARVVLRARDPVVDDAGDAAVEVIGVEDAVRVTVDVVQEAADAGAGGRVPGARHRARDGRVEHVEGLVVDVLGDAPGRGVGRLAPHHDRALA